MGAALGAIVGECAAVQEEAAPEVVQEGAATGVVGEVGAAAAAAGDGLVASERALRDAEGAAEVVDGAAEGAAHEEPVLDVDAAVAAPGLVVEERAPGDEHGRGRAVRRDAPDGAAGGAPAVIPAEDPVADERAAGDG